MELFSRWVLPSIPHSNHTMNARGSRKYFGIGISFKTAARIFFDYDRIEMYDEEHSAEEDRYNTIGDASAAGSAIIGNLCIEGFHRNDILFVVYTERELAAQNGRPVEITRLISARLATNFERGLYYGKQN